MIMHQIPVTAELALLKIEGQLDFATAPAVQDALAKLTDERHVARMVIDLADVTAADDVGVNSLAAAVRRAVARHPALRVVAVAPDRLLAGALSDARVPVYGQGTDALRFADPTHAA